MNRSVVVVVPESVAAKLAHLARLEYRSPRQHAAVLLVEAVERASAAGGRLSPVRGQGTKA